MNEQKRNLELLYEIGTMRYIPRTWSQFLNKNFANLAEHTLRVMWIAIILAKEESADLNKVIKMALIHDTSETRTGDVNYLSRMYTARNEKKASEETLKDTSVEQDFLELIKEYEERQSIEAKIVKDADNLDVDMELNEQYACGIKLREEKQNMRKRVRDLLFTNTAKILWDEIQKSNPHDWHINANNRFLSGDWKK
jgi:putative hydrolase of HD superfamily